MAYDFSKMLANRASVKRRDHERFCRMVTRQRIMLWVLASVLLIGFVISLDLTYIHYKVVGGDGSFKSFCNISDTFNCDVVAKSRFSTILGVPIAVLGALTYLFSLILTFGRLFPKRWPFKGTSFYLLAIALGSVLYSLFLAYICVFEIGAWCVMCMGLYAVNLAFAVLAVLSSDLPRKNYGKAVSADIRWLFGGVLRVALALLIGAALIAGLALSSHGVQKVQAIDLGSALKDLERDGVAMGSTGEPRFLKIKVPISLQGEVIGNPNGSKLIVVYSDFLCPFCAQLDHLLALLAAKYPELKVIRKDFPLDNTCNPLLKQPFHLNSCLIATYAKCAGRFGKFTEFHDLAIVNQDKLSSKDFLNEMVNRLGLDPAAMQTCLGDEGIRQRLAMEVDEGLKLNLKGTPSLVIMGRYLALAGVSRDELETIIQTWMK